MQPLSSTTAFEIVFGQHLQNQRFHHYLNLLVDLFDYLCYYRWFEVLLSLGCMVLFSVLLSVLFFPSVIIASSIVFTIGLIVIIWYGDYFNKNLFAYH